MERREEVDPAMGRVLSRSCGDGELEVGFPAGASMLIMTSSGRAVPGLRLFVRTGKQHCRLQGIRAQGPGLRAQVGR
jgi:hypothetical protein